jgi:hypothetical protein
VEIKDAVTVEAVYELFRGSITADQLAWSEGQIRGFMANRKAANSHLCAAADRNSPAS